MPIPFLLIGIGAGAAALGVGKTIKAGIDQKDAKETNESAQSIIDSTTERMNNCRKNCGDAITSLGETKISVLDESIKPFVSVFEKLHNVDINESSGLDELDKFCIDKQAFGELKSMQNMATSLAGGVAGGAAIGAATAFGAYGAAMTFGAASTGTAIASLSGAAATNATLAFFGGGSLAVGGLGIAGGTAVLGGLVAGPALAIMGFVIGAKASANKDNAYSNLAKAKEYREEMETAMQACKAIRRRANMFERTLLKLNTIFEPLIYSLEQTISVYGTDYSAYSDAQKKIVASSMAMAGAIKSILDTPIMMEDGSLSEESENTLNKVNKLILEKNET